MQENQLNDAYRRVPPYAKEKSLHSGESDRRNGVDRNKSEGIAWSVRTYNATTELCLGSLEGLANGAETSTQYRTNILV